MVDPYTTLFGFFILSAGFVIGMLVLSTLLGPKHRTPTKDLTFECGSVSVGSVQNTRFNVKFYLVAVIFILFDIEVLFLYPWAVTLMDIGWPGLISMGSFMAVLLLGLVYVIQKGVLDWNKP